MPRSLFARTAATFLALVIAFQILLFSISGYFVVLPLARNSVDDLASLMALSAKTWVRLRPDQHAAYQLELRANQRIEIEPEWRIEQGQQSLLPYVRMLGSALNAHFGGLASIDEDEDRYLVTTQVEGKLVHFGFTRDRIGTNPSTAFAVVAGGSLILGLVAALLVARRLTRPLNRLAQATARVGRGSDFEPLPEDGPAELARLSREFNRMTATVRDLLENRTIMLAGVSHDLRSPITRLRMALELCHTRPEPKLLARMESDLERMDALIQSFIEFSRGISAEPLETVNVPAMLESLADEARIHGATVTVSIAGPCTQDLAPLALHRVLANLVDNAVRYAGNEPIEVVLVQCNHPVIIEVRDQGPGVPPEKREDVFHPFVRLDTARSHGGGSGLGLAMVRQIAQAQGWTVALDANKAKGQGLVARVTFGG